jgi:protocatechuate 3,4-dioxygenase beta subunit
MSKVFGLTTALLLLMFPRTDHPDAASLGGRVTDENQRAIHGATVSVTNVFSQEVQIVRSDAAGAYRLTGLRQGRYSVFATAEGHVCSWVFDVLLYRGEHTHLDLTLRGSQKKPRTTDCTNAVRSTQ